MNRIVALATAGALLTAAGPGLPAAAAAVRYGGLSCGMTAERDEAGYVEAVVTGGPWHEGPPRPEVTVTVTCRIEVDVTGGGRTPLAEVRGSSANGVAVVPPQPVNFDAGGAANTALYLCTEITVYDPGAMPPYHVRQIDADGNPSNGAQCAKTEPDDGDLVYVYVVPPGSHGSGDYCVFVPHGIGETDLGHPLRPIPPPPDEVCLPV